MGSCRMRGFGIGCRGRRGRLLIIVIVIIISWVRIFWVLLSLIVETVGVGARDIVVEERRGWLGSL